MDDYREEEEEKIENPLDQLSKDSELDMIAAALPYVSKPLKQPLAMYIKFAELTNVMNRFQDEETLSACGLDEQNSNYELMFQAMKMAANKEQAGRIDQMMRMMNMGKMLPSLMANMSQQSNGISTDPNNPNDMLQTLSAMMGKREDTNSMNNAWMNDPRVKSIAPEKLELLKKFIGDNRNKSPEDLIPHLVTMSNQLKNQGMNFTREETDLILDILKESMSYEERQRVDMIKQMLG